MKLPFKVGITLHETFERAEKAAHLARAALHRNDDKSHVTILKDGEPYAEVHSFPPQTKRIR